MYTKPSKSKHKSRDRWSPWSEWVWSSEHERYYRHRHDANNVFDYEWNNPAGQDTADATVPRGAGEDVDDITEGVQNLSTAYETANPATQETEYQSYAYNSGVSNSKQSKGKGKNRKGKAVEHEYTEEEETGEEPLEESEEPLETAEEPRETSDETGDEPHYLDPFYGAHRNKTPRNTSQFSVPSYDTQRTAYGYGTYGPEPYGGADPISEQQYPTEESPRVEDTDYVSGGHGAGYAHQGSAYSSSTSRTARKIGRFEPHGADIEDEENQDDDEFAAATARAQEDSRNMYHNMQQGSSSETAYVSVPPEDDDDGRRTPRPLSPMLDIRGTGGQIEILDPRYRVEPSVKFQPGEIFKILWSEPTGQANLGGTPTISDRQEIRNQFGSFYVGFRRFIVVANDEGHCTCVPILTYGGKGCKKRGVKAQKHGIICEKGHKARLLENEPKQGFVPVRMMIEAGGEKLARESRVNYSKLVTIEHNVKVFFIGHVIPEDWDIARDAVNKCWEDKTHNRRRRQFQK